MGSKLKWVVIFGFFSNTFAFTSNMDYLYKFIDLSEEYNFQLVFANLPADYNESDGTDGWVSDSEALFNTVADFAKEQNIPFIDYCDKIEDVGLDFANDMNNEGHLNIWGAVKVSADFGNYLEQNFDLPDHRSDSAYAQWDVDYQKSQAASIA